MINLRAETVREKKGWKSTLARKRCIIPIDGFYEWQDQGKGERKQPFYITSRDFSPLALAGLWATWRDPRPRTRRARAAARSCSPARS